MKKTRMAFGLAAAVAAGTALADVAKPTMGWSSWNTYRVNISEELIKRQAKALVDGGYAAVGYARASTGSRRCERLMKCRAIECLN